MSDIGELSSYVYKNKGLAFSNADGQDNTAFLSGDNRIDSLLGGIKWNGQLHKGATVTYTFDVANASQINQQYQGAVQGALRAWASVANVNFEYQPPSATQNGTANIVFGQNPDIFDEGVLGITFYNFTGNKIDETAIYMASQFSGGKWFPGGDFGFLALLHEVGHAIGLKHSGFFDGGGELEPALPEEQDSNDATVMSYNRGIHTPTSSQAGSPMLYDILAVQHLYGANMGHNNSNTVYNIGNGQVAQTFWDAGGIDTFQTTSFSGNAIIDLRQGLTSVTQIGSTKIWIATQDGQGVENAIAGAGNDLIFGNELSNFIAAGPGNDSIRPAGGGDLVSGAKGNDQIEGGTGDDNMNGNFGNDVVSGDTGNDMVLGGKDNDTVSGGDGNDTISGDLGDDIINGGSGADIFVFRIGQGTDTVQDFVQGTDKIQVIGVFSSAAQAASSTSGGVLNLSGGSVTFTGISTLQESDFLIG